MKEEIVREIMKRHNIKERLMNLLVKICLDNQVEIEKINEFYSKI